MLTGRGQCYYITEVLRPWGGKQSPAQRESASLNGSPTQLLCNQFIHQLRIRLAL